MYPIVSKFIDTNIQGKEMIGYQQLQPDGSKKLSVPSTNDPFNYLQQMRQQKHKSSRSDYPTNNYAQLQNLNPRSMRARKGGNRSCSTNSYSSNTTALKSLSEVKDPKLLINFRFVNKGVESLTEISNFRNLTELDLTGNLLRNEVPQLLKLQFLKKLTLVNNRISKMWRLPSTLESLNICANEISQLPDEVMS